MNITIVGTGYVGLVTGTCLAQMGHKVCCIDNNLEKVETLKKGKIPIYEPGLSELVKSNYKAKNIDFKSDLKVGVNHGEAIFLCLPTPPKEDGSADLSYVLSVAKEIAEIATKPRLIINKSTVPVGTADKVKEIFNQVKKEYLQVASNPEFLREGSAVKDFLNPDRIVVGVQNPESGKILQKIYEPFIKQGVKYLETSLRSSELIKYAANSFLATKISFINEISNLCEEVGADIQEVSKGVGLDTRIGSKFLQAGIGYGGSCFPKDVSALHNTGQQYKVNLDILDAVMRVNTYQRIRFVDRVVRRFGYSLKGSKIAVWGLAFKADTDDIRKTPAIEIIQILQSKGVEVVAYDPEAMPNFQNYSDLSIKYTQDKYSCLEEASCLLILTDWKDFASADIELVKEKLNSAVIFDGRNLFNPKEMKEKGIEYHSIGR